MEGGIVNTQFLKTFHQNQMGLASIMILTWINCYIRGLQNGDLKNFIISSTFIS